MIVTDVAYEKSQTIRNIKPKTIMKPNIRKKKKGLTARDKPWRQSYIGLNKISISISLALVAWIENENERMWMKCVLCCVCV